VDAGGFRKGEVRKTRERFEQQQRKITEKNILTGGKEENRD
jgi:hypothetical protein